jgi:hypothetical protein
MHNGNRAHCGWFWRVGNASTGAALQGDWWPVALRPLGGGPAARLGDLDAVEVDGRALQVALLLPLIPAAAAIATARARRGQRSRCGRVVGVERREARRPVACVCAIDVLDGRVRANVTRNARVGARGDGRPSIPEGVVVDRLDAHCGGCCLTYEAGRQLDSRYGSWFGFAQVSSRREARVSRPCRRRSSLLNDA